MASWSLTKEQQERVMAVGLLVRDLAQKESVGRPFLFVDPVVVPTNQKVYVFGLYWDEPGKSKTCGGVAPLDATDEQIEKKFYEILSELEDKCTTQ